MSELQTNTYTWTDNPMVEGESLCLPDIVNEDLMYLKMECVILGNTLVATATNLQTALTNVQDALDAEVVTRGQEDFKLVQKIETTKQSILNSVNTIVASEATARTNADLSLQQQIDAISASSDVKDIVGTYSDLQNYDKSSLYDNDIIKVLSDSTHGNASTYYRYDKETNSFTYIGSDGEYATKSELQNAVSQLNTTLSGRISTVQTNLDDVETTLSGQIQDVADDLDTLDTGLDNRVQGIVDTAIDDALEDIGTSLNNYVKKTQLATPNGTGVVKPDNNTIVVDNTGTLSANTSVVTLYTWVNN